MSLRKFSVLLVTLAAVVALPQAASATLPASSVQYLDNGVERTTYRIGPLTVTPGQNRIDYMPITGVAKPSEDGWFTRLKPNMVEEDGSIPLSSKVMFHHGVWLNLSRRDATAGGPERFYATGEEKTITSFPEGYAYRYKASDNWLLNHMIHNLTPEPMTLYATYTVDFIPEDSPAAEGLKPVTPIWMDVDNGSLYPVYDVFRGSGGKDGKATFPDDYKSAYPGGEKKNEWTVDRDGVLVATAGHVHTGGLYTDLYLKRPGAKYMGPNCVKPASITVRGLKGLSSRAKARVRKANREKIRRYRAKLKKYKACQGTQPRVKGNKVHLFRSHAKYFKGNGPISWDMAMYGTQPDWKVEVKKGDVLSMSSTYETKIASWPESMGIMVTYLAEADKGNDPYRKRVDFKGILNHGHYDENNDHGGGLPVVGRDATKLPDGAKAGTNPFVISNYFYNGADFRLPGALGNPPVVPKGKSMRFEMSEEDLEDEVWHSLTSCKTPCNRSPGISYPIADGKYQFESGQLGTLPGENKAPTVDRTWWETPRNLPQGTYTFFCRVHPLMRGAFRVK